MQNSPLSISMRTTLFIGLINERHQYAETVFEPYLPVMSLPEKDRKSVWLMFQKVTEKSFMSLTEDRKSAISLFKDRKSIRLMFSVIENLLCQCFRRSQKICYANGLESHRKFVMPRV